jgi:ribosomal protein S18 acetylase RimI-like enzyme
MNAPTPPPVTPTEVLYATSNYATDTVSVDTQAVFQTSHLLVRPGRRRDSDAIWAFAQANPEYEQMVACGLPERDAYLAEFFDHHPPPEMSYTQHHHLLAFTKTADAREHELVGLIDCVIDLMARGVGHIGFFQVASRLQGSGMAQQLYTALEDWLMSQGSVALRLGVVEQNARGKAFWARNGYLRIKTRHDVDFGRQKNTVHTMVKLVGPLTMDAYLAMVARDRADTP